MRAGGATYRLKMQAFHTSNLEGDDFNVYYSLDDQAYIRMFTVLQTVDDDSYSAFALPNWIGGQDVYTKVVDMSWANGSTSLDTLRVDHLVLERITIITPNSHTTSMGSKVHSVAVADVDGDGDIDVAAGTASKRVHVYLNANGLGTSWSATTLEEGVDKVFSLAAGDVNGDGLADVVIGTNQGNAYLYQNRGPQGWTRVEIDFVKEEVYGIAQGDVDRGVLPSG